MQYYDINEEKKYVKLNNILNTEINEYKIEKQNFFSNHKYIFNDFPKEQARCVRDYYGVDDGKLKTFTEIADRNDLSVHKVKIYISNFFARLSTQKYINLLYEYTDEDLEYTEEKAEEFNLDSVYQEYIEKIMKKEQERFDNLSKEDKRAELCLNALLDKRIYDFEWFSVLGVPSAFICLSLREALKKGSKEVLQEYCDYKEFFDKLGSYGLSFMCNHKYIEDWEEECLNSIKEFGVEKLIKQEDLLISDNKEIVYKLKKRISDCDFTNGIKKIFKYNHIESIKDLVKLSLEDLSKFRNLGEKSLSLIEDVLHGMGLSLCPPNFDKNEWLEFILNGGLEDKKENPEEEIEKENLKTEEKIEAPDFSQLPEEYRKYYVMGVADKVEKEIKGESPFNTLKNRMISKYSPKRIPEADKESLPKVKLPKSNGEDISNILEWIKDDITAIYSLTSKFINENKDALVMFLFENQDYDATVRKELLDFILQLKVDEHLQ